MPVSVPVDDADPAVSYSGTWVVLTGSSRQWNSAVHSTSRVGSSASFKFRGTSVSVFGTVPIGPGTARSQYSIDGGSPVNVAIQSQPTAIYADLFFQDNDLRDGDHTILVTNTGTDADFQLDRFEYLPSENLPATTFGPPVIPSPSNVQSTRQSSSTSTSVSSTQTRSSASLSRSSTTNGTQTNAPSTTTVLQIVAVSMTLTPTLTESTSIPLSESHLSSDLSFHLPKGALAGIIVAAVIFLFLLIAIIVLVFRKLKRKSDPLHGSGQGISHADPGTSKHPTSVTPFDLNYRRMSQLLSPTSGSGKGARPFLRLREQGGNQIGNAISRDLYPVTDLSTLSIPVTEKASSSLASPTSETNYPSASSLPNGWGRNTTYLHQADWSITSLHRRRNISTDLSSSGALDSPVPSELMVWDHPVSAYGSVRPGFHDAPPPYIGSHNAEEGRLEA